MFENKVISHKLKVYLNAGEAAVTPPLGPLLGQFGVNTVQFCREFNEVTDGFIDFFCETEGYFIHNFELIVDIFIFDDRSFGFIINKPSTSFLLRLLANVDKGSAHEVKFKISYTDIIKIALFKYPEISLYSACKMIRGTARSIGISITNHE